MADAWTAVHFPILLANAGELVRAEEFIAELAERPGADDYVLHARGQVEMRQGLFTPALERFRRILRNEESPYGRVVDAPASFFSVELATALGCAEEVANEVLSRRVLGSVAPAPGAAKGMEMILLYVVTHASVDVARDAVARLRELGRARVFRWPVDAFEPCAQAIEHWANGRTSQVVGPIRSLANVQEWGPLLARVFDLAERPDLAARADQSVVGSLQSLAGLSAGDLRMARRLAAAGRRDEARIVARRIIDAWSVAEDDSPVLAEMRALAD